MTDDRPKRIDSKVIDQNETQAKLEKDWKRNKLVLTRAGCGPS